MAEEPVVPLREHLEKQIADLRRQRDEDRALMLEMTKDWTQWRVEIDRAVTAADATSKNRSIWVGAVFTVILTAIQLWRGAP